MVGGLERNRLAHVLADGTVDPDWNPSADGFVASLAVSGSSVYVGGAFNSVGGLARIKIAELDATTGNACPSQKLVLLEFVEGTEWPR